VEKTKAMGLRIKAPKSLHGRRQIALPEAAVIALNQHLKATLELRMAPGAGRPPDDAFVFGTIDGKVRDPDRISQDWKRFTAARKLPKVTLHALRHGHASPAPSSRRGPIQSRSRGGLGMRTRQSPCRFTLTYSIRAMPSLRR
jgi:integrase